MRKLSLALATTALFIGAFIFTFSSDSSGGFHFFNKAKAMGLTWKLYYIPCPGSTQVYVGVCGPGPSSFCEGVGTCNAE
jgi:hypothetical protein